MNDDITKAQFVDDYIKFARLVSQYVAEKNAGMQTTLLTRFVAAGNNIVQERPDIVEAAQKLYAYDLIGLSNTFESEPASIGFGLSALWNIKMDFNHTNSETIINRLLYPYITFENDEERLRKRVQSYFICWKSNIWPYQVFVPLYNFDSEIDNVELGNFQLRTTEALEERIKWIVSKNEYYGSKFSLYRDIELFSNTRLEWNNLFSDLEKIISTLRLIIEGQNHYLQEGLGISTLYFLPLLPRAIPVFKYKADLQARVDSPNFKSSGAFQANTSIFKKDNKDLLELIQLRDSPQLTELQFALRRFNLYYSRESLEDKLVDLCIALESCLLYGVKEELKYRLCLRAATLLGQEFNPQKISKIISVAYDIRSEIVHNGKTYRESSGQITQLKKYNISNYQFLPALAEVTREILLFLILEVQTMALDKRPLIEKSFLKTIGSALDKEIFDSLP